MIVKHAYVIISTSHSQMIPLGRERERRNGIRRGLGVCRSGMVSILAAAVDGTVAAVGVLPNNDIAMLLRWRGVYVFCECVVNLQV